jgi:hypothetical protein
MLVAAFSFVAVGCGGDGDGDPTPTPTPGGGGFDGVIDLAAIGNTSGSGWVVDARGGIINAGTDSWNQYASQYDGIAMKLPAPIDITGFTKFSADAAFYDKDGAEITGWGKGTIKVCLGMGTTTDTGDYGNKSILASIYNLSQTDSKGVATSTFNDTDTDFAAALKPWDGKTVAGFRVDKADSATAATTGVAKIRIKEIKFHN